MQVPDFFFLEFWTLQLTKGTPNNLQPPTKLTAISTEEWTTEHKVQAEIQPAYIYTNQSTVTAKNFGEITWNRQRQLHRFQGSYAN